MKVLLTVDPEYPVPPKLYGGIERIVDGIAQELRERGHHVGLVAHPDSTCRVDQFFPWKRQQPGSTQANTANVRTLWAAVGAFHPEVIHSFSRLAYLLPFLPRRMGKVMSYQRHTGGRKLGIFAALGGRRFRYTACSEYIAKMGHSGGGAWTAIPNFVDTTFYRFSPTVPADAPLVFLSRVEKIKGTHAAIQIAKRSGRRLVIAGNRPNSADANEYWETEIQPHLEPGSIEYIGAVDDRQKNDLLGAAAAMIVPIEWGEPFGIVFAEALACGTPVISCPHGAVPEIVAHGEHGFLINTIDEGVAAIAQLPSISRSACRNRVEACFSRTRVVDQYEQVYREVVTNSA